MCGRFVVAKTSGQIATIFEADEVIDEVPASYNIAPTNRVSILVDRAFEKSEDGSPIGEISRELHSARWGLVPRWSKGPAEGAPLINARMETVLEKPSFKDSVIRRRCLVPASGYYEWVVDAQGNKQPYYVNAGTATALQGVNVALMSTVDGAQALTLSDSGITILGGIIGGNTPLLSLTTDSLATAAGETQLKAGSIHVTTNAVFNDIVKVFTDVTVQTGGDLKFMQTVNGDTANTRSLTLDASSVGNITVQGVVGGSASLKTLQVVNSNTATFNAAVTTGTSVVLTDTVDAHAIVFNAGLTTPTFTVAVEPFALTLRGNIAVANGINLANTGALQLDGALTSSNQAITLGQAGQTNTLLGNTSLDSGTATTTVNGSLSGGSYTLGFASPVSFSGTSTLTASTVTFSKGVTAAGDLTVNGATVVNGGNVNAGSHTQTYNGSVTVGGLATDTTTFTGVGMTFGSTLDGTSRVLVVDSGNTTYTGAIGSVTAPAHFETNAAGTSTFSGGLVRTSSPNSIYIADDAVVTAASTTFDTTNNTNLAAGANITFAKTLNGSSNNGQAVTINAGTSGVVLISGAVGDAYPLSSLTLTQSYGATFNAPVTANTAVILNNTVSGQTIRFADNLTTPVLTTTTNGYNLELLGTTTSVTGNTTFFNTGKLVLGDAAADTLTFAGGLTATAPVAINAAGTINTSNTAMTLGDSNTALTLTDHLTLNTTGGNSLAGGNLTLGGAVKGAAVNAQSLNLNAGSTGVVNVMGVVGQGKAIQTLTLVNSHHTTFNSLVAAGTSVVLTDTLAGQTIRFVDNLNTPELLTTSNGYSLELLGAVTQVNTINSATTFLNTGNLVLGNGTNSTLTFIRGLTAISASAITVGGTLGTSDAPILFGTAPVTLSGNTVLNAASADITLGGTVDGGYSLALNTTGVTTLSDKLGDVVALTSVTTNAGGTVVIKGGRVTTSGAQTYNDDVLLDKSGTRLTTLNTTDSAVFFGGRLNNNTAAPEALTINAGNGAVTFTGAVGEAVSSNNGPVGALIINSGSATTLVSTVDAASVTTNAGGTVVIKGGRVTTSGAQTYNDGVILDGSTNLNALRLLFGSAVNGNNSLSIVGATTLTGGSVSTVGTQTYADTITLGDHATLTSSQGTLNFVRITDAGAARDLNLNAATALTLGDVTLGGALHVTSQATGVTQLSGTRLNIAGPTTFTADVGVNQDALLTSVNNRFVGLLTFDQIHNGSWRDVSVKTNTALVLAPLQSSGSVSLQTQGAALTTSTLTVSGNVNLDTRNSFGVGGPVSLGAAIVSGNFNVQTGNGSVSQTGQLAVSGNTAIIAGTGTITMLNPLNNFAGTLALQGNSTAVASSGNLQLASVTNTGPMTLLAPRGSIDLGSAFITGGDLTLQSQGNLNLGGANITGSLNMSSTTGTVSFDQATVTGNLTAATNGQSIDLGVANVGGNLSVQTNGGNIVQSTTLNSALHVTGTSNLNAGTGNITLPNIPNQFGSAISLQANNVQLVGNNSLVLANSTVTGNLSVTSVVGNVTQMGVLKVGGDSVFNAVQGNVVLDQANAFSQSVAVNSVNATINAISALQLGSSHLTGSLIATAANGDITQVGPIAVAGTSILNAPAGNITLADAANSFGGRVSVDTPQALRLTASGALSMGKVNVGLTTNLQSHGVLDMGTESMYTGKLKVNSGGFDIIQSGPLKAGADQDLDAGSAKIDLFNPKNLWMGALFFKGGVIMVNHPQLLNAVNSGVLIVRTTTTTPVTAAPAATAVASTATVTPLARVGGDASTPPSQPTAAGGTVGSAVSVVVNRTPTSTQTGVIQVQVSAEVAAPGKTFSFEMDPHAMAGHAQDASVKISQMDGMPLPNWLRYDAATKTFTATDVPASAFPLQLKVSVGNTESVMVIQEKPPGK